MNAISKATESKPTQPGIFLDNGSLTIAQPDPTNPFNSLTNRQQSASANNPAPKQQSLVDFFASIETEQTSIFPTSQQQTQFPTQSQVYANPSFPSTYPQPANQQFSPTANQQFFPSQQSLTPQQQFTTPQQPIRPEWTGAGFGGYTPSSAGSSVHIMPTIASVPSPQTQFTQPTQNAVIQPDRNSAGTNPFRASMLPQSTAQQNYVSDLSTGQSSQGTNPFSTGQRTQTMSPASLAHPQSFSNQTSYASLPLSQSTYSQPFQSQSQPAFSQSQPQQPVFQQSDQSVPIFTQQGAAQAGPQVSSSTGTNPFSRPNQIQSQARLTPQVTGSNPFRQSVLPGGKPSTAAGVPNGFGWSQ